MPYDIDDFGDDLDFVKELLAIVEAKGYALVSGNFYNQRYEKTVLQSPDTGNDEAFTISVIIRQDGDNSVSLSYRKNIAGSTSGLSLRSNVSVVIEDVSEEIDACEEAFLLTGADFNEAPV